MSDCCEKLMDTNIHVPKKTIDTCLLLRALGNRFRLNCDKYEKTMLGVYDKDEFNFSANINEKKSI